MPTGSKLKIAVLVLMATLLIFCRSASAATHRQAKCPQHTLSVGGFYPYSEDGMDLSRQTIPITGQWTTVMEGCAANHLSGVVDKWNVEQNSSAVSNLLVSFWTKFLSVSATPGAEVHYEVRFILDNNTSQPFATFDRKYGSDALQADSFAATLQNIAGTYHAISVQARVVTPGATLYFTQSISSIQGAPNTFGSAVGTVTTPDTYPYNPDATHPHVVSHWSKVLDNVSFSVPSGQWDIMGRAYVRLSAPAGHDLRVSMALDGVTQPGHTATIKSPGPNGAGFNFIDDFNGVGTSAQPHHLSIWVTNDSGGSVTVQEARLDYLALPQGNGGASDPDVMGYSHAEDTKTVDSAVASPSDVQPVQQDLTSVGGKWTRLLTFQMPQNSEADSNWLGGGYVELLGRTGDPAAWAAKTDAEIAIETVHPDGSTAIEMGWKGLSIPDEHGGFPFFIDAAKWGNEGNTINIWMRKVAFAGNEQGSFQVGRRWLSVKLVRSDSTDHYSGCDGRLTVTGPGTTTFSASGGTASMSIHDQWTGDPCEWTAASSLDGYANNPASWITFSRSSGTVGANEAEQTATVSIMVAANSGAARSAVVQFGANTYTVTQGGVTNESCATTLATTSSTMTASAASGSISVTSEGCPWTAVSNATWLSVTSAAGVSPVTFSVAANTTTTTRIGTLAVGAQNFVVTQYGVTAARIRGDFNGDGFADLLWRNASNGQNRIWLMNNSTMTSSVSLPTTSVLDWRVGGVGDMNGDGYQDIVLRNPVSGANAVWFMHDTTYVSSKIIDSWNDADWQIVSVFDLGSDGSYDLLWHNDVLGQTVAWQMNGTTNTGTIGYQTVADNRWRLAGTADLRGLGQRDLFWHNAASQTGSGAVAEWYMSGFTISSTATLPQSVTLDWRACALANYNNDSNQDVVWQNSTDGSLVVWYLTSTGTVSSTAFIVGNTDPAWVVVGPR
ncbi:MAG: hypothetical protein QOI24_3767 [Acidobacteriota bacterium]|jgi:hypothetical protein|nr:hypothetical protein [Acidobacteriota bacterium]